MRFPSRILPAPLLLSLIAACASPLGTAQKHFRAGEIEEAAVLASEALVQDPQNGEALLLLASISMRKEEYPEARDYLERAEEADPDLAVPIDRYYMPALEEMEAIEWVLLRMAPSLLETPIARFRKPVTAEQVMEHKPGWARVRLRQWVRKDVIEERLQGTQHLEAIHEAEFVAYVEFDAWIPRDGYRLRIQDVGQGLQMPLVEQVDHTRDDQGNIVVFGTVVNNTRRHFKEMKVHVQMTTLIPFLDYFVMMADLGTRDADVLPELVRSGTCGYFLFVLEDIPAGWPLSLSAGVTY